MSIPNNTLTSLEVKQFLDKMRNLHKPVSLSINHAGNGKDEFTLYIEKMRINDVSDIDLIH